MTSKPDKPRWFQFTLQKMLLLVAFAGASFAVVAWHMRESPPEYYTLEQLLALNNYRGYELIQGPDLPGPYTFLSCFVSVGGPDSETVAKVTNHGKLRTVDVPDTPDFNSQPYS